MAKQSLISDRQILEVALIGLQSQLSGIDEAISGIRSRLGHRGPGRPTASPDGAQQAPKKRTMSATARKRIGEATRKRWAALRNQKAKVGQAAEKPKRKMSAAGKARIIAATKKRWAAFHKAQKAAPKKARKAAVKAPVAAAAPATT